MMNQEQLKAYLGVNEPCVAIECCDGIQSKEVGELLESALKLDVTTWPTDETFWKVVLLEHDHINAYRGDNTVEMATSRGVTVISAEEFLAVYNSGTLNYAQIDDLL